MFDNKVCVITGGANGIGRCISRAFAEASANIAFIDLDETAGRENKEYLLRQGVEVLFMVGDIAEEITLKQFTKRVIEKFGQIDYLINNAGYSLGGIHTPCSFEDFNKVLRVGVSAPYMLTQLFLPYFNERASIVNVSSSRAFMSQANTESYSAAKGGLSALTHALAISLAGRVRVNSISPGWIDTGFISDEHYVPDYTKGDIAQHPSNRVGVPEDIANVVLFLCENRNSFINGENITVDGGMSKRMIYSGDEGWEYHPE